jgi:hypothetical protein
MENGHTHNTCLFGRVSAKIYKFKLKHMQPKILHSRATESQNLNKILTYVQNLKGFFDLNNC